MSRTLTSEQARALAAMRKTHGAGPGRPKGSLSKKKRCYCGKVTMHRAKRRGFDCCRKANLVWCFEPPPMVWYPQRSRPERLLLQFDRKRPKQ